MRHGRCRSAGLSIRPSRQSATVSHVDTLSFVDFASSEPEASADFDAAVFGWKVVQRPAPVVHQIGPGQNFQVRAETHGYGFHPGCPQPVGNLTFIVEIPHH